MSALNAISSAAGVYTKGGIETLDYLRAKLTPEGYESHLVAMTHKKLHKALVSGPNEREKLYRAAAFYMAHLLHGTAAPDQTHDPISDQFTRLGINTTPAAGTTTAPTAADDQPPVDAAFPQQGAPSTTTAGYPRRQVFAQ